MAVCPKLAEGDIVRITRVGDCGGPVTGPDNAFVDDCWASIVMAPNVEDGTDIDFRAMNGRSCGFKRGCPSFRGYDITARFFSASPKLIEIMTGNPVYLDANGDPVGWDDCSIACGQGFALEIWQNVIAECPEEGSGDGLWFYWVLPWVTNGILGDIEIGQEGVTFELTGNTRAGGQWGVGPWDVQVNEDTPSPVIGPMLTPVGPSCHRRGFLTSVAPPTAACDYVTVPA